MSLVNLENSQIKIAVDTHGAELRSLIKLPEGREYMWCGDPEYWGRVSPVLFPFVGKLNNQTYRYKDRTYDGIPQHGFARDSEFEVVEKLDDTVWMELIKDQIWEEKYPFNFTLRIGYKIEGRSLHVMWTVVNHESETLHFSIGAHPAFACQGGIDGYELDFHNGKDLLSCGTLNEKGVLGDKVRTYKLCDGKLKLESTTFDEDAMMLDGKGIYTVTLSDRNKKPTLQLRFDAPQLGIWSPAGKNAPFVCIEPWFGRADREGFEGDLSEREYGNSIEAGHSFSKEYVIDLVE